MAVLRRIRILPLLALVSLLASCADRLTPERLEQVKQGMSPQEVHKLLGKPTAVETQDLAVMSHTIYTYRKGDNEVVIRFLNDKLITKTGSFGP